MSDTGYVKLHRKLLDWEWWDDHNATRLLTYLLVKVNWRAKKWQGITINPGSLACSWEGLSKQTGLSKQQVRTAMDKLQSSGEITRKTTNRYQLVSLVKWDKFQSNEDDDTTQGNTQITPNLTDNQQADNTQITPTKEGKELKKGKKKITYPDFEEFEKYAIMKSLEVGIRLDPIKVKLKFIAWKDNGWKTGGDKPRKIENWKSTLTNSLQYMKSDHASSSDIHDVTKRVRVA